MKHGPSVAVRLIVYPLTLAIFAGICAVIVFMASGYDIRYKDGRIYTQKTGIIIIGSRPGDAAVEIDGQANAKNTPSINFFRLKLNRIKPGVHRLSIKKDGYETWDGEVEVEAGMVSWLDYVVLIPKNKKPDEYNLPGSIESSVQSFDNKRIVLLSADRSAGIYSIWLANTESKQIQKISEGKISLKEKIELLQISNNYARYIYKKIDKNNNNTFIVAEAKQNGGSSNLNSLFNSRPQSFIFSPYRDSELYFLIDGNLYKINIIERNQSAALTKNVIGLYPNPHNLSLIQKTDDNYGLWQMHENNTVTNIIKAIPSAKKYNVSYISQKKKYLVHNLDDKDLMLYQNSEKNPTLETIAKGVEGYKVSYSGERVAYYAEKNLKVYDLEKEKYFNTLKNVSVLSFDWLSDGANLIYRTSTNVKLVNFDGDYNKDILGVSGNGILTGTESGFTLFYLNTINKDLDLYSYDL